MFDRLLASITSPRQTKVLFFLVFTLAVSGCNWTSEAEERNQCKDTGGDWVVERNVTPDCTPACAVAPFDCPQAVVRRHAYCACPDGTGYFYGEGCQSLDRCEAEE
jgi:hypothetical protein